MRQEWQARLNDMNLKLQGAILQNVQTVWGLAANVSVQPDITEAEFQQLASVIFSLAPQLRNIGLAPDLTIRNIYPLEGNEAALGLDLTSQSLSPEQVKTLTESRKALFSGPINLVQGGQGMAARIPIFENGSGQFWGVISVILDLNRLYNAVDMASFSENGYLALFKTSSPGLEEDPFFGAATTQWQDPITTELNLPGITWTLFAQPSDGWPSHPESPVLVRSVLGLMVLLLFAGAFWLTSLLLRDHQMQRRFSGLFELAPFGIGLYAAQNGKLLRANNSFEKLFGNKANSLNFFRYIYDHRSRILSEELDIPGLLEKKPRFSGLEGYFPDAKNELNPVLLHGLTLDTLNGDPAIWLIAEDISEQKKADRVKSEFISIVSHELRTPLTSIAGSLGLLSNNAAGELPQKASRLAEIAYRNTQQLTLLINDLLDIEKLVAGKMAFNMADCPVAEIVRECLEGIESFSVDKKVTLKAEHLDEVNIKADRGRLCQALNNLLSNAIKFSPEDSVVTVYTSKSDHEIRISVSDQGQGIPSEFRDRIFQKFSQADSSDRRAKGGTGLGLAITRELLHAMGGEVGFDSEEGKGACFWLSLPFAEAEGKGAT
ncbi:ATP-binding protein [Marinobacter sp. es.042]|uniref:ATP-binding protein n=1 Tax=Marinobacter sp. es.042 TaxID=1761794 RepID=UPI001D0D6AF7|nr:ATP-binding protein [Marinobacter sp. es.042]